MKTTLHLNEEQKRKPLKINGYWRPTFTNGDFEFAIHDTNTGIPGSETIYVKLDGQPVYQTKASELIGFIHNDLNRPYKYTVDETVLTYWILHLQKQALIPTPIEVLLNF